MSPVHGRGKVILLGEHGVVYGRPAVAAALDRGVTATAEPGVANELVVEPWGVSVKPSIDGEPIARALHALLSRSDLPGPLRLRLQVDLPAGAGLGCSAAMGVAIVRALDAEAGISREPNAIADASMAWERVFHGQPSGIDSAVAALGGVIAFRRGEAPEPLALQRPLHLVVADSGEAASTKTMVESVARQRERAPDRVEKVFDGIAALVQSARVALASHDMTHLGSLMNLNHALLSSLMLSTERIEALVAAAKAAGALGAKLTGSGGGGCVVALTASDAAADHVRSAVESAGGQSFVAKVSVS